jgi:acyl carrier protein
MNSLLEPGNIMQDTEIIRLIQNALAEVAPTRKADFNDIVFDTQIEALGLDSIATMEMVGILEDTVETTFPDEDLTKVTSIGDLATLVKTHGN